MLLSLVVALALAAGGQTAAADRSRAEGLARSGRNAEALELFTRVVDANPADAEARLWIARLDLRLGRTAEAEAQLRTVLRDHPSDIDARIGLATVLTRNGEWQQALELLRAVERDAGQNADLFAALARAYRRGGDDRRALEYFKMAKSLSPNDPDLALGYEGVARTYGHWIALEGFLQAGPPAIRVAAGTVMGSFRVTPSLHLDASARTQWGSDYSDTVAGGGLLVRAGRSTTVAFRAQGGANNVALPQVDLSGEVIHYAGIFEAGAGVRRLSFAGSSLVALSPTFAWDREPWRLDVRDTISRSSFDRSGLSEIDNSVMLRGTWQAWRRAAVQGVYAYGIESFEELTADRLASLGATTLAGGVRIDLPSLTRITSTWEHQWRSNDTRVNRFTVSLVQSIP